MTLYQPGILAPVPQHARYLEFGLYIDLDFAGVLQSLASWHVDETSVIGFGPAVLSLLGHPLETLRSFPEMSAKGVAVPSTQADLWCWFRGDDRGELVHQARKIRKIVEPAFQCDSVIDGFMYDIDRDLSGYVDGTENPEGDKAVEAAIANGLGPELDGSSFVAVQHWVHDLDGLKSHSEAEQDDMIGRRLFDNDEFEGSPPTAHTRRSSPGNFDPKAYIVRRSMPWADATGEGLQFVAFGKTFDAFEAIHRRMIGEVDGIVDGLFNFTKPVTGSYFWCPPVKNGTLNLSFFRI